MRQSFSNKRSEFAEQHNKPASRNTSPFPLPPRLAERARQFKRRRPVTDRFFSADLALILNSMDAGYLRVDRKYVIREINATALRWLGMTAEQVIGRPFSHVAPNSPMRMLRSAVEGTIFIDRELRSYQFPERLLELHVHSTAGGAIIYFRDITQQRRSERDAERTMALLQSSLDALSAHVVILDQGGRIIASNRSWQVFANARGLVAATNGCEPNYLALLETRVARHPEAQQIATALRSVLCGRRQSTRLVYAWQIDGRLRWFQLNAARFESAGEPYLAVTNEDVTTIKEAEHALGHVAERLLTLQEEERRCIAEELHDSTVQHLVAIGLNVMQLQARSADPLLEEIEGSLDEASKELRTLTYLLHPPSLEREGLHQTLRNYADGFAKRSGLQVASRINGTVDALSFPLQRTILRIVQESLANVHRHASATRVRIDLRCFARQLHLIVHDDGKGIPGATEAGNRLHSMTRSGVGLPGINARLQQFGGELQIQSGPGGTRLHAVVPLGTSMAMAIATNGALVRARGPTLRDEP